MDSGVGVLVRVFWGEGGWVCILVQGCFGVGALWCGVCSGVGIFLAWGCSGVCVWGGWGGVAGVGFCSGVGMCAGGCVCVGGGGGGGWLSSPGVGVCSDVEVPACTGLSKIKKPVVCDHRA